MATDNDYKEMQRENAALKAKIDVLQETIARIIGGAGEHRVTSALDSEAAAILKTLTPKQHAVLLMILGGASNGEIGHRFGVRESTAKVYVRGIMRKMDARTRTQVVLKAKGTIDGLSDDEYRLIAGIGKDWHSAFDADDPANEILFAKRTD